MRTSGFGAAHPQYLLLPVQIAELKAADLTGAQAIGDQQHQDRTGTYIGRTLALGGGEKTDDLVPVQPLRNRLSRIASRRHDPVGQARCAPAVLLGKPEEGTKMLRIKMDRGSTVTARVIARGDLIDHGDPDRREVDTSLVQPEEEAIDRSATAFNRGIGPSALAGHPCRKIRDHARMGVARSLGYLKPAQKAQPSFRMVEESSTRARL